MKTTADTVKYVERFGQRVRLLREERSLSQEELAERAEVHRTYIGMIERGEKNATIVTIIKLSGAIDIPAMELLREIEEA